jgi:CheY-specific phosphatase CheX
VTVLEADVEEITRTLWSSLFDLSLVAAPVAPLGPEASVTACIQIVGRWRGAVVLQCPMALARTLAEQMFQSESPLTLEEIRDALGEVANVIGGNVKALFPGPSQLSLPTVTIGADYELGVVESSAVTTVGFVCAGESLTVNVFAAREGE